MKLRALPLVVVVLAIGTAQAADNQTKPAPVDSQQLVQLNTTATQIHQAVLELKGTVAAAPDPKSFCYMADKAYTEGAICPAGNVLLVCVEREWGVHELNAPRELVWEPTSSKRITLYRQITGLGSKK